MGIVTIATAFGTHGADIGREVARRLHLAFVDRAIPQAVARTLGIPLADVIAQDDKSATGLWRLISSMAMVPDLSGSEALAYNQVSDERLFKAKTEEVLRHVASTTGGVIVGRAGVVVLADVKPALHVRLTGPIDRRVEAYSRSHDLGIDEARQVVETNDKARLAYGRNFYRCDLRDPRLYHLVIDETSFDDEFLVQLIVTAAKTRGIEPGTVEDAGP